MTEPVIPLGELLFPPQDDEPNGKAIRHLLQNQKTKILKEHSFCNGETFNNAVEEYILDFTAEGIETLDDLKEDFLDYSVASEYL